LTRITETAPARSRESKVRPATSGIPIALKYAGVATL
jgi:hypothetical protein